MSQRELFARMTVSKVQMCCLGSPRELLACTLTSGSYKSFFSKLHQRSTEACHNYINRTHTFSQYMYVVLQKKHDSILGKR